MWSLPPRQKADLNHLQRSQEPKQNEQLWDVSNTEGAKHSRKLWDSWNNFSLVFGERNSSTEIFLWHEKKQKNIEPFDNSNISHLGELKRQDPGRELPASQSILIAKAANKKLVSILT